tara:strand:- start:450 stop:626 length:177 start_codon:yes stop_codon:yes gene_type:complete
MKWSFSCFICGHSWKEMHRKLKRDDFVYSDNKEGRPVIDCPNCLEQDIHAPIVGNLMH